MRRTCSNVTTLVAVFRHDGFVMETTIVEICPMSKTAVSRPFLSVVDF